MLAKRTRPAQIANPLFSETDRRQALKNGEPYDTPKLLTLPVGEIVTDPDCWRLCMPDVNVAVPADDECAKSVAARIGEKGRQALLEKIRRLGQPEVRKQLGKSDLVWLESMEEWHRDELTGATMQP